jgi:hypothetical protein
MVRRAMASSRFSARLRVESVGSLLIFAVVLRDGEKVACSSDIGRAAVQVSVDCAIETRLIVAGRSGERRISRRIRLNEYSAGEGNPLGHPCPRQNRTHQPFEIPNAYRSEWLFRYFSIP